MNLRRQLIRDFVHGTKAKQDCLRYFSTGESFLLPHDGLLMKPDQSFNIDLSDLHLPFQTCILEFSAGSLGGSRASPYVVSLKEEEDCFLVAYAFEYEGQWAPAPAISGIFRIDKKGQINILGEGECEVSWITQHQCPGYENHPVPKGMGIEEHGMLFTVFAHFVMCANCTNISPVKVSEPDVVLQKRAAKRGLPPFNSYWGLSCSMPDQSDHRGSMGGSHATPRLHVRRGHVRALSSGKLTWVRQCLVGNPDRGVVEKDYHVRAAFIQPTESP